MALPSLEATYSKYNARCHYCSRGTVLTSRRKRGKGKQESNYATREHIVPQRFGGSDNSENIVLACHDCNNKRGDKLFFCTCSKCERLIKKALNSNMFINKNFDSIIDFNRVKVIRQPDGRWKVFAGNAHLIYPTFTQAITEADIRAHRDPRKRKNIV